jgi:phage terminase small subunit
MAERTGLTGDMVIIVFENMADYMKSTPECDPYLDFSALTRDQPAALSEVTVEDFLDRRGEDARAVRHWSFSAREIRTSKFSVTLPIMALTSVAGR